MKVIYYGHSAFSCEVNGKHLLFDPYISENALASKINCDTIKADYIFISHGHFDHVGDLENIAKRTSAILVANFEIVSYYQNRGIKNVHPMNVGGSKIFDFGKVKMIPAVHSSVLPDGTYAGCAAGFVIESSQGNFYYSGDTALHYDMKLVGEMHHLNWSALPIGDNFTMGVDDAINAASFIKCDKIMGVHYNTFPYIAIDKKQAIQKFSESNKKLVLVEIGEEIDL